MAAETERPKKTTGNSLLVPDLSVDLVVDILSRLPVKSLCRFKCVSRRWHQLCSDPRHRKNNKLPRTLSGFFYQSISGERFPVRHFANVSDPDPPPVSPAFSFLPHAKRTSLVDCCDGLFLCRRWEGPLTDACRFVVFNPAVERWVVLPDSAAANAARTVSLAFDPVVSSHFHVLAFLEDESYYVTGMDVYSSQTRTWSRKESEWSRQTTLCHGVNSVLLHVNSVLLHGMLHLDTMEAAIVAIGVEGDTWRTIPVPQAGYPALLNVDHSGCLGASQDQLYYMQSGWTMSIWVLEEYGNEQWILKHNVDITGMLQNLNWQFWRAYRVIAIHPERDVIFFQSGPDKKHLVSKEVHVICSLGHDCESPVLAYVPLFSELMGDGTKMVTY